MITVLVGFFIYKKKFDVKKEKKDSGIQKKIEEEKKEEKDSEEVVDIYMVDIKGQIVTPGIYSMNKEARIIDVIEKAGGLTEFADTSVINLSKKIWDEMVIIIYSKEEVSQFEKTKEVEEQVQNRCIQKEENAIINDACIVSSTSSLPIGKISINTASLEQLMSLKGIGESKAKDIIDYREKNGPFKSIEEIMNVPGIGESRFAQIKEDITV